MNCPTCQTENPETAKFCLECGARLGIPSTQPRGVAVPQTPAQPPTIRNTQYPISNTQLPVTDHRSPISPLPSLIPPDFAAKLETARTQKTMEGERRIVTMLFSDVKGSTAAAGQLDPEDWARIMNGIFEHMIRPVYKYEGTVARLMGDAILAFFGAPVAHEDDPQRAILAGLEIIEGFKPYREQIEKDWKVDVNVRVGINTGLVMVGAVGSDLQMEYTALGDAINLAARMEQTATPGTVQISEDTYNLAAPLFEWEDLGGIQVKGKEEPVHTYRPLRPKEKPGRLRGLESHGISSPLVGRETEFEQLRAALEGLQTGQGSVALLLGEAGLGKSRLIAELRQLLITNYPISPTWLEGRTLSFGQTISYWPFQEILRAHAGIREDDEEHTAWEKLETRLATSFGEQTPEVLPYLASLLSLHIPDEYAERVKYLDAEALGRQVFFASRRFFERLAEENPLVLVFEDIHWMDGSSARLLEHLIPLTTRVPLLLIGLSRPDWNTPILGVRDAARSVWNTPILGDRVLEIELHPLSGTDSAQLVRNLLEIEALPARVRDLIIQKSDGNPFFLEEVIRTLISTGAVARNPDTGHWRATTEIDSIHIPDTIQGVIMARVDRLDEEVKRVLRTAAVIGRSFLYRVLRAVDAAGDTLDQRLVSLQEVELIREKQRDPELEFIFKHALAQEAAYENTLLQTRRALHARVGAAIETLFPDREEFYGLLAYHYARAENWQKAQEYLFKAGDQAGRVAADAEALTHYQQAMAAYERAFGDQWDPLQRAGLERKIGEALFRRGEHEEARKYLCRALDLLGKPFPTELSAVRPALIRTMLRQAGHRLLPGIFLRGGQAIQDSPALREELEIYNSLIWIEVVNSPERFMLASVRCLNLAERAEIIEWISEGFSGLQVALDFFGIYRLGGYYGHLALKFAERCNHPNALALANQNLVMHASWTGDGPVALSYSDQSAQHHRGAGNLRGWGAATMLGGETQVYMGDFDSAQERAVNMIRDGQDGGDPQVHAWGYSLSGPVAQFTGHLAEAVQHFRTYFEIAESIDDAISMMEATTQLAHCYAMQGDLEAALPELAKSEQYRIQHNVAGRRFVGRLHNVRAEVYLLAVEQNQGDTRKEWFRKARVACKTALKFNRAYPPWLAWSYRLQGRCDQLGGKTESARRWFARSLAQAEKIGQVYEASLTNKIMVSSQKGGVDLQIR